MRITQDNLISDDSFRRTHAPEQMSGRETLEVKIKFSTEGERHEEKPQA